MKRPRILFSLCLAASLWSHVALAAQDPSDIFVQALLASQAGEKLKSDGKTREALAKFRFAAGLLDQIRTDSPKWQPLVREYRSRKTAENIADLEAMSSRDQSQIPPALEPALPDNALIPGAGINPAGSSSSSATPETSETPEDIPGGPAGSAEASELRRQISEARLEIKRLRQQNIDLTQKYEFASGNLRDALKKVDQGRVAVAELRSNLAQTEDRLRTATAARTQDANAIAALKKSVTSLQEKISERTADTNLVEEEANDLSRTVTEANRKASEALKTRDSAVQERDSAVKERQDALQARDVALADLEKARNSKTASDQAIAANAELTAKLDAAEKKISELNQRPQAADVAALRSQITDIQAQLATSQEESKNYATNVEELKSQLEVSNKALEEARKTAPASEETQQLKSENDLLRGIVVRTVKEQIKRNQAREIVAEELARIEGKSQTLLDQVDLLGSATLTLTDEERKLFKEPDIAALNASGAGLSVEMTQADNDNIRPKLPLGAKPTDSATAEAAPAGSPAPNAAPTPSLTVPDKYASLVSRAKSFFDKGDLAKAESAYKEILIDDPNNLYALSNLGVVHYKAGRLPQAEKILSKAAAIAPKDFFVNCTLGIVYYRESKFERAIEALTQAITIDPSSATAHNYLGIAASQKGWIEAAVKELDTATTLNPNYPDAWFNLAVIHATSEPPSLDKARDCYRKAVDLGAQPDASLEKLFN